MGKVRDMSDDTYNGWTNRETWAVALHINNDQGWQESVLELLRGANEYSTAYRRDVPGAAEVSGPLDGNAAGDLIRENVEETLSTLWDVRESRDYEGSEFYGVREDIGSLWRVNWDELGASFLADLEEVGE